MFENPNISSTKECFEYITNLLNKKEAKLAGDIFERFTYEWHLFYGEYIKVYDTNNFEEIPFHILEKIDAVDLLSKGANSFGIDKIAVTREGEIDIHQDKSGININKRAGTKLAQGMMSLRNNPLKNIRNFVLNTMFDGQSHYYNVWKDSKPLIYGFSDFYPDENDINQINKDLKFWEYIKDKNKGPKPKEILQFKPRDKNQTDYILKTEKHITNQYNNTGKAKGFNKASGALGKSVLDPIVLSKIQNKLWNKKVTNSPGPLTISFYHSSETISVNGSTEVNMRRTQGIYDEVIIVSGTEVTEGENAFINTTDKFYKAMTAPSCVDRIISAFDKEKSVLLITLYHHAETIQEIIRLLKKEYKNFIPWARKRDECDWPCSNYHSQYAPALDERTDSVITFGSSGTERHGKDPNKDYGTNNTAIHGPLLHEFSWAEAEKSGLLKPLVLICPTLKMSQLCSLFPEFNIKKEKFDEIDFQRRVTGVHVNGTYPTIMQIIKIASIQMVLLENPQIKRMLAVSNFIKTNELIKRNWQWVGKKVLPNTREASRVYNLYHEVLNDDGFNQNGLKNRKQAIKRAKSKKSYVISSCRVFSRGYNDLFAPIHHAGFTIDPKGDVDLVQFIWRLTRLDKPEDVKKHKIDDTYSYFIQPIIQNDLNPDKIEWEESSIESLSAILKGNKNICDHFESIIKNGSNRAKKSKFGSIQFQMLEDFDPELLKNLINTVSYTSKGSLFPSLVCEAHDWLYNAYMQLEEPENAQQKGKIHKEFYKIGKFKSVYGTYKNKIVWRERFFHGTYNYTPEVNSHINDNIFEYKKYCKQAVEYKKNKIKDIRKLVQSHIERQILPHTNYSTYNYELEEKYNISKSSAHAITGKYCMDIIKNKRNEKKIYQNVKKTFELAIKTGRQAECQLEWAEMVYKKLDTIGVNPKCCNVTTIINNFLKQSVRKNTDLLSKKQLSELNDICTLIRSRANVRSKMVSGHYKNQPTTNKKLKSRNRTYRGHWDHDVVNFLLNKPIYEFQGSRATRVGSETRFGHQCSEETRKKISEGILKKSMLKKQQKLKLWKERYKKGEEI